VSLLFIWRMKDDLYILFPVLSDRAERKEYDLFSQKQICIFNCIVYLPVPFCLIFFRRDISFTNLNWLVFLLDPQSLAICWVICFLGKKSMMIHVPSFAVSTLVSFINGALLQYQTIIIPPQ
jgi:hypothetical protein